jgi:hypothetical protein
MAIRVETFVSAKGGSTFFKAIGHPQVVSKAQALAARLREGRVAIYDPLGMAHDFAEFHDVSGLDLQAVLVQRIEDLGSERFGRPVQPVTALSELAIDTLFVAAFDARRLIDHIRHLIPSGVRVVSLDDLRVPEAMLTNRRRYLDPLNFATNFGFFRDADGWHTRIVTADYWSGWGASRPPTVWLCLFDQNGAVLAEWQEPLAAAGASLVLDSQAVRRRFGLPEFTGSLFMHVVGVAPQGHDVVKYALTTYGDDLDTELSCTHDANAWPSDLYAGLPAPCDGERVTLWIQNSHPLTIPRGGIGLNLMGSDVICWLDVEIPPFACYALDVASLLPDARWPQQIEVQAGRYFVRPRYEVKGANGRLRIAHANVERNDLRPDPGIAAAAQQLGKGYLLPAPILPLAQWNSVLQPTPMSTAQTELPITAIVYDASGHEVVRHPFGRLPRNLELAFDLSALAETSGGLASGYGHVELVFDFSEGGEADGWLHALFRYTQTASGHTAESSFGAHVFNTVLTYRDEPQSYAAGPPGLSTRLFLQIADAPLDTFCHLIYPASTPWHAQSATHLHLYNALGVEIAVSQISVPCSGSRLWRYSEMFDADSRCAAGSGAYVIIRDTTCRLFGYHGLINCDRSFCIDHMFGF